VVVLGLWWRGPGPPSIDLESQQPVSHVENPSNSRGAPDHAEFEQRRGVVRPDPDGARAFSEEGAWVMGTVQGVTGRGLGGAAIHLYRGRRGASPPPKPGEGDAFAFSEPDGTFRFAVDPEGVYSAVFVGPAGCSGSVFPVRQGDDLVLLLPGGRVAGAVVDFDQGPVEAFLTLYDRTGVHASVLERTDEMGTFSFDCLAPGSLAIWIEASGYVPESRDVLVHPGLESEYLFVLQKGTQVRGTVVDAETGAPVSGAEVFGFRTSMWSQPTGTDGSFLLDGCTPNSHEDILIASNDHCQQEHRIATPGVGESTDIGRLEIHRGACFRGQVVDSDGTPRGGVRVRMHGQWKPSEGALENSDWAEATTERDGSFEICRLRARFGHTLVAEGGPYGVAVAYIPGQSRVGPGGLNVGIIVLVPTFAVSGILVDDLGRGVASARLSLEDLSLREATKYQRDPDEHSLQHRIVRHERSALNGRYWIEGLTPGEYTLTVRTSWSAREQTIEFHVFGDTELPPIILPLGRSISGVVADPNGEPLANVVVVLHPGGDKRVDLGYWHTGPDGVFELSGLDWMPYDIDIRFGEGFQRDDLARTFVEDVWPGDEDVEVRMTSARCIHGEVSGGGEYETRWIVAFDREDLSLLWDAQETPLAGGHFRLRVPVQADVELGFLDPSVTIRSTETREDGSLLLLLE